MGHDAASRRDILIASAVVTLERAGFPNVSHDINEIPSRVPRRQAAPRIRFSRLKPGVLVAWEGRYQNGYNGPKPGDVYRLEAASHPPTDGGVVLWGRMIHPMAVPPEGAASSRAAVMFYSSPRWPTRYVGAGWAVYENIGDALGGREEWATPVMSATAGW